MSGSIATSLTSSPATRLPPPMLTGGLPFLGHTYEFWSRPVELLARGQARFGDVWSLNLAGQRATVLTGPVGNEAFFRAPDTVLSARESYQFTVPVFGEKAPGAETLQELATGTES